MTIDKINIECEDGVSSCGGFIEEGPEVLKRKLQIAKEALLFYALGNHIKNIDPYDDYDGAEDGGTARRCLWELE